ncbi:hypothetical protein EYF80_038752 [Liparis tanakae]|uniref:Uncharacterized protein n=1 Tax=Liparis tanakae TaxID=230148 RepID=A0A4Z2GEC2_9TELE|nr:hypothetical protein EYF80_038752 [Liparis tanakae]
MSIQLQCQITNVDHVLLTLHLLSRPTSHISMQFDSQPLIQVPLEISWVNDPNGTVSILDTTMGSPRTWTLLNFYP